MQAEGNRLRVLAKRSCDLAVGDPVELVSYEGCRLPEAHVVHVEPDGQIQQAERDFLSKQKLHPPIKSGEMVSHAYRVTLDRPVSLPRVV